MRWILCAALAALAGLNTVAHADVQDDRILAAREAANKGDAARLANFAANPSSHVLEPYVQSWYLLNRLARINEAIPEREIRDFLWQNDSSVLAERLRTEWLKRLSRDGQNTAFNLEYANVPLPDQELQCMAITAAGPMAPVASLVLEGQWLNVLDAPAGCVAPMQAMAASGRIPREMLWQRMRRQVEGKRLTGARQTANWLPSNEAPDDKALARAIDDPARFLKSASARDTGSRAGREVIIAAFTRWARTDVMAAYAAWQAFPSANFRNEEQAYVMGQFAWMAAMSHRPQALDWFAQTRATSLNDDQLAWQVRMALRAGDWGRVMTSIQAMPLGLRNQPDWTYWLGRAMANEKQGAEARALWQKIAGQPHFYGILAAEALGSRFVWPTPELPTTIAEMQQVENNPALRRAVALAALDLRTEALREWSWALRGASDRSILAMAELARREGLYDRAINAAERTRQQHDFSLRYLAPYFESFSPYAKRYNLDLPWLYGLVRQESRFHPVARSAVGAQGLMQVMPATGKWMAKKINMSDYRPETLGDVDVNLQLGTAYMRLVLDSLGGNTAVASAAYNAGPGRARRWKGSQAIEGAIYAETIPFNETRDYVKKVMANAVIYAALFDGQAGSLIERLGVIGAASASDAGADKLP